MISINGRNISPNSIIDNYPVNEIERKIIDILANSSNVYRFSSLEELIFELKLRSNTIDASRQLNRSRFSFTTFRNSFCNEDYWERTNEGGFLLKRDVSPSSAINDIFMNGRKYGTECATAIPILFYKAVLDIYPTELFDRVFSRIHLMNWSYLDRNLDITHYVNEADYLPGDCRYFKNPDVNSLTPHWQGENAIDLGNGTYYGHGIGITTADNIIRALNSNRRENATRSAYLMDSATRLGFRRLANIYNSFS